MAQIKESERERIFNLGQSISPTLGRIAQNKMELRRGDLEMEQRLVTKLLDDATDYFMQLTDAIKADKEAD